MLRLHQLNHKQSKQNYFQVTASSSTMSEAQPSVLIGCNSENNNVSFGESKLTAPSLSNYFYNCCPTQDTKPGAQEANQDLQKGQMSTKTSKTVSSAKWSEVGRLSLHSSQTHPPGDLERKVQIYITCIVTQCQSLEEK